MRPKPGTHAGSRSAAPPRLPWHGICDIPPSGTKTRSRASARLGTLPKSAASGPKLEPSRSDGAPMLKIDCEPYPFALEPAQAALVIIDMQRDFLEEGGFASALGNDVDLLRRTIEPTRKLLAAARAARMLVIHTREGHRPDLSDLQP